MKFNSFKALLLLSGVIAFVGITRAAETSEYSSRGIPSQTIERPRPLPLTAGSLAEPLGATTVSEACVNAQTARGLSLGEAQEHCQYLMIE
jgi:hypothetical protein